MADTNFSSIEIKDRSKWLGILIFCTYLFSFNFAFAIDVNNSHGLNSAIASVNGTDSNLIINLCPDSETDVFKLSENITLINTQGNLTIRSCTGQPMVIDGATYAGFVILNGTVNLENLIIKNMIAPGGSGCMGSDTISIHAAHVVSDLGIHQIFSAAVDQSTNMNANERKDVIKDLGELSNAIMSNNSQQHQNAVNNGLEVFGKIITKPTLKLTSAETESALNAVTRLSTSGLNNLRPGLGPANSSIQEHLDINVKPPTLSGDSSGPPTPRSGSIIKPAARLVKTLRLEGQSAFMTKDGTPIDSKTFPFSSSSSNQS